MKLLYGTERVDDATIGALAELAKERGALKKMKAMQASCNTNPSFHDVLVLHVLSHS